MLNVRPLRNPPITEGLIDIRVDNCQMSQDRLLRIADSVKSEYPRFEEYNRRRTLFQATLGGPTEIQAQEASLFGGRFSQEDGLQIVQFRADGFTLNRLAPYSGWERVFPEAMKLWNRFVDILEPTRVKRVAVRYINHVPLDGLRVKLEDYLITPAPIPPDLACNMTSFLTSVVLQDHDSPSTVKVTQSLEPPNDDGNLVLLLDIDASQSVDWDPSEPSLPQAFEQLRALKNKVFFSSFSESAIGRFDR